MIQELLKAEVIEVLDLGHDEQPAEEGRRGYRNVRKDRMVKTAYGHIPVELSPGCDSEKAYIEKL